jgi:hypothetical protein
MRRTHMTCILLLIYEEEDTCDMRRRIHVI